MGVALLAWGLIVEPVIGLLEPSFRITLVFVGLLALPVAGLLLRRSE